MNKAELVESVQKLLGKDVSKAQAERAVEAVIDGIKGGLKKGKPVQLVGFGTFKVVHRKARMGVNPKTGQPIKIKASKSVKSRRRQRPQSPSSSNFPPRKPRNPVLPPCKTGFLHAGDATGGRALGAPLRCIRPGLQSE